VFRNILVAIDGSPHAARALVEAIDLAERDNARLTIMTTVPDPSAWLLTGAAYGGEIDHVALNEETEREYQKLLDNAVSQAWASGASRTIPARMGGDAHMRGHRTAAGWTHINERLLSPAQSGRGLPLNRGQQGGVQCPHPDAEQSREQPTIQRGAGHYRTHPRRPVGPQSPVRSQGLSGQSGRPSGGSFRWKRRHAAG
jgi:Universal stress protein family